MACYGTDYRKMIAKLVLRLLAKGPRPIRAVMANVEASESTLQRVIKEMVEEGVIVDRGSAGHFGYPMRGNSQRAYGLPLGDAGAADDFEDVELPRLRSRPRKGSGVIAPAPYVTGYRWGNV